ncbi:MAG TPA: hypothetical protein VHS99_24850, partial [Chloroflexota bacterium]|nr:hypothetical protein [Chloroflexota bacterium]
RPWASTVYLCPAVRTMISRFSSAKTASRSGRPEMGYRTASDWGRGALRDAVFAELKREIMVRTAGHKYTVDAQGRGFQLYDMRQDPREQRNLVGHPDYREAERELRERLLTWLVSTQVIRGNEARPGA